MYGISPARSNASAQWLEDWDDATNEAALALVDPPSYSSLPVPVHGTNANVVSPGTGGLVASHDAAEESDSEWEGWDAETIDMIMDYMDHLDSVSIYT